MNSPVRMVQLLEGPDNWASADSSRPSSAMLAMLGAATSPCCCAPSCSLSHPTKAKAKNAVELAGAACAKTEPNS